MVLFSVAAHEMLPISDAYCGISHSFLSDRTAVQFLGRLQRHTQQGYSVDAGLSFAVGQAIFAHPQVWNVMVQHQVIQARQHGL
ncbi:MAG: hypothetical protein NTX67_12560 [Burkholderiales bacterium]|nr:hypothetical protein [Burkholderiales bacterium]